MTPVVFQVFASGGSTQRDSILRYIVLTSCLSAVRYDTFNFTCGTHAHALPARSVSFPIIIDGDDDEKKKEREKKREKRQKRKEKLQIDRRRRPDVQPASEKA